MEKNNISQNNNVIKKMLTCCILMCLFMLSLCSSQAFAASRYKYVCTMENGDNYTIITENTDDGFKIIGSYSEIYSKIGTSYATGRSLYDLIATEYESTTTESSKKERAKELLKLLEIFVANRKNSSGAPTDAQIAINGDVIVSGSNGTIQYGQNGTNGKKYDVIIEEAKNDKKNPYYNKDGEHKRNKILYISERLDIFYTDYELIKAYENCEIDTLKNWITKTPTEDSYLVKENYRIYLDTQSKKDNIFIRVCDDSNETLSSFLVAERIGEATKYEELGYTNNSEVGWYSSGGSSGIATTGAGVAFEKDIFIYYHKAIEDEGLVVEVEKEEEIVEIPDKYEIGDEVEKPKEEETEENKEYGLYEIKTIQDKYYNSSSKQLKFPNDEGFIALRNSSGSTINVYSLKFESSTTDYKKSKASLIGAIPLSSLDFYLNQGDIKTSVDEWVYSKEGNTLKIYKEDEINIEKNAYYLHLNQIFDCYTKDEKHYDVAIPIKKGIENNYEHQVTGEVGQLIALITSNLKVDKNYESLQPLNSLFNDIFKSHVDVKLVIYEVKEALKTDELGKLHEELNVPSSKYFNTNSTNDLLPPSISITEFFTTKDMKEFYAGYIDGSNKGANDLLDDTSGVSISFIGELLGYGKTILALLLFIGIVMAGLHFSLVGGINAEERVKTILKFKHLIFGAIILIIMIPTVMMMMDYMDQGFSILDGISAQTDEILYSFEEIDEQGLLLDLLTILIRITNDIMSGLIDIFGKMLAHSSQGIDYIALVYDCYDEDGYVSTLKPFENEVEWTRCLSGYGMLTSIAFFMLLLAIVKTSIEYIIKAGDEKKITQIKEVWYRIFWAVLLILCVPYIVQALIYLFNYLTAVIPVDVTDPRFNLDINLNRQNTFISALARNIFLTTKCNLYMTFLVRKVMLSVLLVSGPIVIATWAISEKFRSFHIWIGELITNIAMQFCYSIGFLVVVLLSFDSENAIYGILLVSLSLTFSKFIKESLQGYFQGWGGIDEEAVGSSVVGRAFGWGKKAKNIVGSIGSIMSAAGGLMEKAGTSDVPTDKVEVKDADKAKKTEGKKDNDADPLVHRTAGAKVGIGLQNVGAIMQGDVDKVRFGRELREEDLKKKLAKDKKEAAAKEAKYEKDKEKLNPEEQKKLEDAVEKVNSMSDDEYNEFMNPDSKLTPEEKDMKDLIEKNDSAEDYIKAKRQEKQTKKEYNKYVNVDHKNAITKMEKERFGFAVSYPEDEDSISSTDTQNYEDDENDDKFMNQHGKDDIDDDELEKTARLSNQSGEHAQNAIEKVKSENNDGSYQKMKSLEYAMEEMKMMAIYDAMNFQCVQEEVLAQLIEAYAEQVLKVTSEMGAPRNKEMIIAECTEEINRIYRNGLSQKKRAIKIASKNN